MGRIQQTLVTGVGVGGGHGALHNAELLVQDLDKGCQAVCGARSIGDDGVRVLVVVSIHADHIGGDLCALGRGGDEHLQVACGRAEEEWGSLARLGKSGGPQAVARPVVGL